METPKTLVDAIKYFSNPDNALEYFAAYRWPNGVECPYCQSKEPMFLKTRRIWKCRATKCRKQFSVKVGTLFNESPIGLDKWLIAIWLISNCKNGISSYEIARDLGVTQKTAWFMLGRIRDAMQSEVSGGKLAGEVEVDETFIGGKARNMHSSYRKTRMAEGHSGKVIAFGMVERGGKVRTAVVNRRSKPVLQAQIREHIQAGSAIFSDELLSYEGLSEDFKHAVINHAVEYVRGNVHTNTMENFWSLVKRGLNGTYVSVEPFHLFRYLDEQAFRYNNREVTDADRFRTVCRHIAGRRLTWNQLTGKEQKA